MLLKESWVAGSFFGCELYCSVEYRVYTLHFAVLVVRLLLTPFLVKRLSDVFYVGLLRETTRGGAVLSCWELRWNH